MSNQPTATNTPGAALFIPTAAWIDSLAIGDLAPDFSGNLARVVEIRYKGVDVNGAAYVGVYLEQSPTSRISDSYKAGQLHRSMAVCREHTADELRQIETRGVPTD